jgi:photosystem II stability/assembly factor-like uncharacterized protein
MRLLRGATMNLLLVAMVVVDVLLVGAAVRYMHRAPALLPSVAGRSVPVTGVGLGDSAVAGNVSDGTATSSVPGVQLLSLSSASDAWRAVGGCDHAPALQATRDGGETWRKLKPPVAHVLRIEMTGVSAGWVVGADSACAPIFYSTADAGKTWTPATTLGQAWVVESGNVRTPSGAIAKPCGKQSAARSLAPSSTSVAFVVCSSALLVTTDGGLSWRPVGAFLQGGLAVGAALETGNSHAGVALLTGASGCSGLDIVRSTDIGMSWRQASCLVSVEAPAAVSIAPDGSGYVVGASGDARSPDGGASWSS